MGEIKSTLDLVMERTRHLTLSENEKAEQNLAEFHRKLEGVIQKYLDGALRLDEVRREEALLAESHSVRDRKVLLKAVLDHLAPDSPPEPVFSLVQDLYEAGTAGLEDVFGRYRSEKAAAAESVRASLEKDLASARCISGSAVTVNLEASADWEAEAERLRQRFNERLEAEKRNLLESW